ncbi:translocation/assembly module TamB domain-containing protein [Shewanella acanthi]|nr:translocation/assembly module TamB domain-containing protein [Shewanella acanthi]
MEHQLSSPSSNTSLTPKMSAAADTAFADKNSKPKESLKPPVEEKNATAQAAVRDDEWPLAHLPQVLMPFPVSVSEFVLTNTSIEIGPRKELINHLSLKGSFIQHQLLVDNLAIAHPDGHLTLAGKLALEKDYPLSITLDAQLSQLAELPDLSQQSLSLTLSDSLGALSIKAKAQGDANFNLEGNITLKDPELVYHLNLKDGRLQWPLKDAEYKIDSLQLESRGNLKQQSASINANVTSPFNRVLALNGELEHGNQKLTFKQFNAEGELGIIDVKGELDYSQAIAWNAEVLLDGLKLQEISLPKSNDAENQSATTASGNAAKAHSSPPKANATHVSNTVNANKTNATNTAEFAKAADTTSVKVVSQTQTEEKTQPLMTNHPNSTIPISSSDAISKSTSETQKQLMADTSTTTVKSTTDADSTNIVSASHQTTRAVNSTNNAKGTKPVTPPAASSVTTTAGLPDSLISGHLQTSGEYRDNHWQVSLTNTVLSGTLHGYPFDISADVSVNDKLYIDTKGINAKVLGSTLTLQGTANKTWQITGELAVPDFGLWLPQASGQLQTKINVSGDEKHPQVEVNSNLVDFMYGSIKLRESTLKALYKPLDKHEFSVSLASQALQLSSQSLETTNLDAKGNIETQSLTLNATGDLGLDLSVSNQYDPIKTLSQTQINRINLSTPVGKWSLNKDILIGWDQAKNKGSISPFCLDNPNSKICLDNSVNLGKNGEAQISYNGSPGKLLIPVLPRNMKWDGSAAMLANVAWAASKKPTAKVNLEFSPGSIKLKRAKREVTIDYQQLALMLDLDAKRLLTTINFESENVASWQSEMTINVSPDRSLSGYANIKQINLQPLGEFFPQINTLEGLLTSRLTFAGSLETPEVAGNIDLTQAAIALTANPTLINKMNMSMVLGGQQASVKGRWMMGNGMGQISGDMRWPQGLFSGEIAIKGDKLAVIQPPLALLDVSPDLTIAFSQEQLELKGTVDVPSGNIKIVQLAEGGVALSEDVVFDDSIAASEPKPSPYAIVADLNINVGNDLKIDGMGLNGKLQGTLKLQQQAFRPPLLFGDIKVMQGSYKFMGQTLNIRTGEVQFVGPTSVPNLNIEAIREIKSEDLVAGVRITGTPARPVVTLFSNPAKEQAEILSYIVKGSGFNSSNNDQNNSLMMGAALGLSSQVGGGGAINSIGSTATGIIEEFGFSNVQLDTNDEGRVAISGYIGEKLMVKYGVGVFNPGYEMTVRYYLLSQLYLEAVNGTLGQSLDLYYNFNIN